jgi:hypothetical protein
MITRGLPVPGNCPEDDSINLLTGFSATFEESIILQFKFEIFLCSNNSRNTGRLYTAKTVEGRKGKGREGEGKKQREQGGKDGEVSRAKDREGGGGGVKKK